MKEKVDLQTYAIIQNADSSILNLNPLIKKYHFEFQEYTLIEFESKFKHLINLPLDFNRTGTVKFEEGDVSMEFYKLILDHPEFGISIFGNRKIYLLSSLKSFNVWKKENNIDMTGSFPFCLEVQSFLEKLITQLRLFKSGNITFSSIFQLYKDSGTIALKYGNRQGYVKPGKFQISKKEVLVFKKFYKPQFEPNVLSKLAIENFELTYDILNPKIEFTLLINALESIFNLGKDQISHTISRHVALIISHNQSKFKENYKIIKDLYALRSSIVHGNESKKLKDLNTKLSELKDIVRTVIRYCLDSEMDKDDLFHFLNSKGTE